MITTQVAKGDKSTRTGKLVAEPRSISGMSIKDIYHLLSGALGQCVPVSQIIDFDIFDVVAVLLVDIGFELACALPGGRRSDLCDWALRLVKEVSISTERTAQQVIELTDRMGGTSTC